MSDWDQLDGELAAWRSEGRSVTLWWRDDDAVRLTPALERLLDLASALAAPVALAVVPRDVDPEFPVHLARYPLASVLQHGWSHENHAPGDDRQEEFGPHRPLPTMLDELRRGRRRLADFPRFQPVLVAPWNRIDPHVLPYLPLADLGAVSTLGPRASAAPSPGVRRTNVHVDIVDWGGFRGFVGESRALAQVVDHLRLRRHGDADPTEPTGLMTHHAFHDEDCWRFVEQFVGRTRAHAAVRWLDSEQAFWS